jgi:hypothetical protein
MDEESYWSPLFKVVRDLRCWVRVGSRIQGATVTGRWGQLLTIPTPGYLEGPGGPLRIRDVEWVEVSTRRIKGGIAGRPRQLIDLKDEIVAVLRGTQLSWELRHSTWSVEGVLNEEPVQVIRVGNPFGPTPTTVS